MSPWNDSSVSEHCLEPLDIFILAGGLGTRIRPVLGDMPKLLAMIAGRPYLQRLLDWLRRFGARRIVLGLGHRAQAVIDHLGTFPPSDLTISHVVEPYPLGTAGAIRFARAQLYSDPVLVMNGDSFADADLCGAVACHRKMAAVGTILCAQVQDAGRYGRVALDSSGYIQAFVEKDSEFHESAVVNAGIYLLSAALLDEIAAGQAVSLEHDVFEHLPPGSLAGFMGCFNLIDIGTPDSLDLANSIFGAPAG